MAGSGTASNPNNLNSPRRPKSVPSPWNQIVRGESEAVAAAPSSPLASSSSILVLESSSSPPPLSSSITTTSSLPMEDFGSVGESSENGNAGKRPAWNKPSNGVAAEIGPVMGAVSWPALSESTRATTKTSPELSKGLTDGSSVSVLQGPGSTTSSSQRQDIANTNHTVPAQQRSTRRNGSSASSNSGHPHQSAPPGPIAATAPHNSSKENTQRSGFTPQSHNASDHTQQRNSFRNRNGGPHHRGDGSHHHSYGSRREQDRGKQDWNAHRNFNGRDSHMRPQVAPRRPQPPANSTPFIHPASMRPFGAPMGFPELGPVVYVAGPSPESLRGVPFLTPLVPPVFFPPPDPQLHTKIVNQIDYYFSDANLIKDIYLRQNMDDQGWVPIKLIAGFNKVMHLTDNIQLILDAVRSSSVMEVQGDKVRRQNEWRRWIMPASVQFPNATGSQSLGKSSSEKLARQVQSISLDKTTNSSSAGGGLVDLPAEAQNRSSFEDLNGQVQLSGVGGTSQVGILGGSDHSNSARN
ncbi:la-related protein 1C-like [Quillaja saponaria]|uniref:La-related protein 1C-like n=1 Tax=Quillaja saponaria TaxID=32244 RepID=A0AAD7P6P9_QUISA|nr:la-related protein 1C-like [Quillaja saponaria]